MAKQDKNAAVAHTVESIRIDLAYATAQLQPIGNGGTNARMAQDRALRALDALDRITALLGELSPRPTIRETLEDYNRKGSMTHAPATGGTACTECGTVEALFDHGQAKLCGNCVEYVNN
jgi:hypothetical protein